VRVCMPTVANLSKFWLLSERQCQYAMEIKSYLQARSIGRALLKKRLKITCNWLLFLSQNISCLGNDQQTKSHPSLELVVAES